MTDVTQIKRAMCKHTFLLVPRVSMGDWLRADNGVFDPVNNDFLLNRARWDLGELRLEILLALSGKKANVVCGNSWW